MRALRSILAATACVCLCAAACGGGPVTPTATPEATPTATPSPEPTAAPSLPIAILDPSMTAEQLLDDDIPAAELNLEERSRQSRDHAVIRDVQFTGADGQPVPAFLIAPTNGRTRAGMLFLHWLGDDFSSRDEFVDEAVALAAQGVESMLITQHFPWAERPLGVDHDRVAIGLQVRTIRRALTLLAAEVGNVRMALVGHDYGAMYGSIVAGVDHRLRTAIFMTPTAHLSTWNLIVKRRPDPDAYAAQMAIYDPAIICRMPRSPASYSNSRVRTNT